MKLNRIPFALSLILFSLLILFSFSNKKETSEFELRYSFAGLGSNMGTKQPVFMVKNGRFLYTLEQNSFYEKPTLDPDTLCEGEFSQSSQDSIIKWISNISDTLIYESHPSISSGGLYQIYISHDGHQLEFRLHNSNDPVADKIILELNKHIPENVQKLSIFKY